MLIRMSGFGLFKGREAYFKDPWNYLDFFIVLASFIFIKNPDINVNAIKSFRMLRSIRAIATIKELKILLNTLIQAIQRLGNVMVVILFCYFVYSVIAL